MIKNKNPYRGVWGDAGRHLRVFFIRAILYLATTLVAWEKSIMGNRRTRRKRKQHINKVQGQRLAAEFKGQDLSRVLVVAIDGAKKSHKALLADGFGEIITDTFGFPNDLAGAKMFAGSVRKAAVDINAFKIIVGLEPTGHYAENLVAYLLEQGFDVRQVNSFAVSREREAGLTWSKTDEIDLCAIGQLIINGKSSPLGHTEAIYDNMKYAARARRSTIQRTVLLESQIHAYMDRLFPGFLDRDLFSDPFGLTSMAFMARYSSANAACRAGATRIERWLSSRRGVSNPHEITQAVVELAQGALRRPADHEEALIEALRFRLREHDLLEEQVGSLNIRLAEYLVETPGIWLLAIDRVSVVSAAEYLGELGQISRYDGANQIIARAGMVPRETQSGMIAYSGGITKLGHPKLRYILGVIGHNLLTSNRYFQAFYNRLVDRGGKNERLAKTAVAGKFVRVSWAMMNLKGAFEAPTWCEDDLKKDIRTKMERFLKQFGASQIYRNSIGPRLDKVLVSGGQPSTSNSITGSHQLPSASGTHEEHDRASTKPIHIGSLIPVVLGQMAAEQDVEAHMA